MIAPLAVALFALLHGVEAAKKKTKIKSSGSGGGALVTGTKAAIIVAASKFKVTLSTSFTTSFMPHSIIH